MPHIVTWCDGRSGVVVLVSRGHHSGVRVPRVGQVRLDVEGRGRGVGAAVEVVLVAGGGHHGGGRCYCAAAGAAQ